MVRCSNGVVGFINILSLLLSIQILGTGIWLGGRANTDCEKFLQLPLIVLGSFLLAVSFAGIVGSCCRSSVLMWIYLLVTFVLIVLVFCFTIFAFLVTNKGAGEVVSNRGFKEYRLADFSNWLRERVADEKNWEKIRSCLIEGKVCKGLQERHYKWEQFINANLSPIQSGCCKPPTACNFTFVSETVWNKSSNATSDIQDCNTWKNDQSILCYNCQSCRAGLLANLKSDWKKVAIVNIIVLVLLILVYTIGCCAYKNNKRDNFIPYYMTKGGNHA